MEMEFDLDNWDMLSRNPNAIHLLEQNPEKINWEYLSGNPNAIHLLEQNPDKINWHILSMNPNAIPLLEKNIGNIDWKCLLENPNPKAIHLFDENNPDNKNKNHDPRLLFKPDTNDDYMY
jgi:exonuclease V gamma subunit